MVTNSLTIAAHKRREAVVLQGGENRLLLVGGGAGEDPDVREEVPEAVDPVREKVLWRIQ